MTTRTSWRNRSDADLAPVAPTEVPGRDDRHTAAIVAVAVEGMALAVVVGATGSVGWRVVRVALVAATTTAVVAVVRSRTGASVRGLALATFGLIGTVVGAAIGVAHLANAGLSPRGVGGAAALAAGLVLLVAGATGVVRSLHGWRRWLAVPVGLVVFQFVLIPAFGAVVITNPPPASLASVTPLDRGVAYEAVRIPVAGVEGVELAGWYVPSRNGAAVVVLHGSGSTRTDVLDQASVLVRHGYGTLLVDARGHGESDGYPMGTGWFGGDDVVAAVGFLDDRDDVDPGRIGVLGESMGGEQAVTAAAIDRRIRAVVGEGAQERTAADHVRATGPMGLVEQLVTAEQYLLADLLTDAAPPQPLVDAVVAARPTPILLIVGAGEGEVGRRYRDASPDTVELWELPDTAHTAGLATHPAEWEATVVGFFDRTLGVA